jgi:hypothetical protein
VRSQLNKISEIFEIETDIVA